MQWQIMPVGARVVRVEPQSGETWVLDTAGSAPYKWVKVEDPLATTLSLGIPPGTTVPPFGKY